MPDRREFLGQTLALAGAASLIVDGTLARAEAATAKKSGGLRILILGGTGFIGPHHVRYAVARGHQVSVFNRGKRQADLPDGVEHLTGDRNGDLQAITGRDWDAVIDLPTLMPAWVRSVAAAVKKRTKHYTFISSLAVYTGSKPGLLSEDAELREYKGADPFTLQQSQFNINLYGPLKVVCEREAARQFKRTFIVRPGLIVGPGDETDRFTYWPVRIKRGGEILAPGNPLDPVQFIDVRDLAEFVIRSAENRVTGAFNATGPASTLTFSEMLGGIRGLYSSPVKLTWVPSDWLVQKNATMADLPAWYPPAADIANRANVERAVAKGMTYRPLATTVREIMEWQEHRPAESQQAFKGGWKAEREQEMLTAWHSRAT